MYKKFALHSLKDKLIHNQTLQLLILFYNAGWILTGFTPIYGGDEYAYVNLGKYLNDLGSVFSHDPYIQKVASPLYLKIVNLLHHLTPDFIVALRILNIGAYFSLALFVHFIVRKNAGSFNAFLAFLLIMAAPSVAYQSLSMPETLFYIFVVISLVAGLLFPKKESLKAVLLGLGLAAAYLLKPHAISLVFAVPFGLLIYNIFTSKPENTVIKKIQQTLTQTFIFYITFYCSTVLALFSLGYGVRLNPSAAVGEFYAGVMTSVFENYLYLAGSKPLTFLKYFLGNLISAIFFTYPMLALCFLSYLKDASSYSDRDAKFSSQFCFSLLLAYLAASVFMTSLFTFTVSEINPAGEGGRLHARYYGYNLLITIVIFLGTPRLLDVAKGSFTLLNIRVNNLRFVAYSWFIIIIFGYLFLTNFRVWFQDNPELYTLLMFFNEPFLSLIPLGISD